MLGDFTRVMGSDRLVLLPEDTPQYCVVPPWLCGETHRVSLGILPDAYLYIRLAAAACKVSVTGLISVIGWGGLPVATWRRHGDGIRTRFLLGHVCLCAIFGCIVLCLVV